MNNEKNPGTMIFHLRKYKDKIKTLQKTNEPKRINNKDFNS